MVLTVYLIAFILGVIYLTYPKDFITLITNPGMMLQAIGLETRRRWMLLTIGLMLWYERTQMAYSLWQARDTIKAERAKQHKQEETHID